MQRLILFVQIGLLIVVLGAAGGATINAVNAVISPEYFEILFRDGRAVAVARGAIEGTVVATVYALLIGVTLAVVTRLRCDALTALQCVGWAVLAVAGMWVVGGALGVTLAATAPQIILNVVGGPPPGERLLRYAWVGGSIWGAEFGGLFPVILVLGRFRDRWRAVHPTESPSVQVAVEDSRVLWYAPPVHGGRRRPWDLAGLFCTIVITGPAVGAITNAINGKVSPEYFRTVMDFWYVADIWRASVLQGVFEGSLGGVAVASLFVTVVVSVTGARCPYRIGMRWIARLIGIDVLLWFFGGFIGMIVALVDEKLFRGMIPFYTPPGRTELARFAWVGGSIVGTEVGGGIATIAILIVFSLRWSRTQLPSE